MTTNLNKETILSYLVRSKKHFEKIIGFNIPVRKPLKKYLKIQKNP